MLSLNLVSIFLGAVSALLFLHNSSALINTTTLIQKYFIFISVIFIFYFIFGVYKLHLSKIKINKINKKITASFYITHIHFKYKIFKLFYTPLLLFITSCMLFFAYANYINTQRLNLRLEENLYNSKQNIDFKITSLPIQKEYGWQFEADIQNNTISKAEHILVNIYDKYHKSDFMPQVGEVWNANLKLKPPYANQNHYVFDYEFHLFRNNIHAIASTSIRADYENNQSTLTKIKSAYFFDKTFIEQIRQKIQNNIYPFIKNLKWKNVMLALIIGNQSQISIQQWTLFNASGIGHLISISGLHITMFALFAASIPLIFIKIYPRVLFYINKRYICASFGLILSGIYVLISGAQIPAQRTWIMLFIAFLTYRRLGIGACLCLTALIIMLIDPWCVGSASFWLSFGAVAILIFIGLRINKINSWQNNTFLLATKSQIAISLAMIPISIFIFGKFSLVSPLANAVAIPIVSYIISPLLILTSLLSYILPSQFIYAAFNLADILLNYVMLWCEILVKIPMAYGISAIPNVLIFILSLCGSICLILPYKWRWYGIFMFIPLFMHNNISLLPKQALITFFDVGQGSSILVSTANHNILFDTGAAHEENVVAEKTVIPSMQGMGVNKIDKLIISHSDKDHSGGIDSITKTFKIDELVVGMELNHELLQNTQNNYKNIKLSQCQPNTWSYDGVNFSILHPLYEHDFTQKTNDNSCVLRVSINEYSTLLTGDIEKTKEYVMVDQYKELLKTDVLLSPHHGSKTSSSIDFLNATMPKDIVIQNGFLNMYKHPHTEVLDRYTDINANVWRTDKEGAIQMFMQGDGYSMSSYKQKYKRYWMM